jgi:diguanylate cyclase (GGDEF)-like protein
MKDFALLRVYSCLAYEHDIRLVAFAAAICLLSALTAFTLAGHVRAMTAPRRHKWIALTGSVTGAGIWATHFIAMLAYQPHLPTVYSVLPTLLSILIAIGMSCLGWSVALSSRRFAATWAGLIFTSGIATMHFVGMAALKTLGTLVYDPYLSISAILLAGALAIAGMNFRQLRPARLPWVAAISLTLAICALHFGAMASVTIMPGSSIRLPPSAISNATLTVAIAALVLGLFGAALATLVIDTKLAHRAHEEREHLKRYAEGSLEGLAILDGDRIVDANAIFWSMAGIGSQTPVELSLAAILPADWGRAELAAAGAFTDSELRKLDGGTLPVETALRVALIGNQPRQILVVRDISARLATADRISHLTSHDPLTGAVNTLGFTMALEAALAGASEDNPVALLCLDLDRFKTVNDLHGHLIGDAVLVEFTARARSCLGPYDLFARLGGDEFAVLVSKSGSGAEVDALADRIISSMSTPIVIDGTIMSLGVSVGMARLPQDAGDGYGLRKCADLALYRAKALGRGTRCWFEPAMDKEFREQSELDADLQHALVRGEFAVHYQPIACMETGGILGFEALVRWHHPTRGDIPPSRFVPMVEANGMIGALGDWVLEQSCRAAQRWTQPLKVAINLSALQFADLGLVNKIRAALSVSGLDPARLELEITEGVLIEDTANALEVLREIKALGVRIAMDDFGTGFSSLSYFRMFPFDKVKIDQSFVRDMAHNRQSMAIVKAVIGMAKALDMLVLAEGVETDQQLDILAAEGCHQVQGYLIGRPAPVEMFGDVTVRRSLLSHRCANQCDQCLERLRPPSGIRAGSQPFVHVSVHRPPKVA